MDADGSGLIGYAEFAGMVRGELRLSHRELPERRCEVRSGVRLGVTWCAGSCG